MLWAAFKSLFTVTAILAVMLVLGISYSPKLLVAWPVLLGVGVTFSCIALIFNALAKGYDFFTYYFTLFLTPMMFLSGIFFPLEQLPAVVRTISSWLPLTNAVELVRPLFMDQWPEHPWRHLGVLARLHCQLHLGLANLAGLHGLLQQGELIGRFLQGLGAIGGGFARLGQRLFAEVGCFQPLAELGERLFGSNAAKLQHFGVLPVFGSKRACCANLSDQFSPFGLAAGDLLRCFVVLDLPFLLSSLAGCLISPGLLAFLDQGFERRLFLFQGRFGGRNVKRLIGADGRMVGRTAERAGSRRGGYRPR